MVKNIVLRHIAEWVCSALEQTEFSKHVSAPSVPADPFPIVGPATLQGTYQLGIYEVTWTARINVID